MVEKASYELITKLDDIEIRQYDRMILASVEEQDDNAAFGLLFNYISGENSPHKKIEMTAPVITQEKIQIELPNTSQEHSMAFILPSSFEEKDVPMPKNPKVHIKVQPKKTFAVVKFSGKANSRSIEENTKILMQKVKLNNLKTFGKPFLMRYNSPFSPGFIRRNELAVEIAVD